MAHRNPTATLPLSPRWEGPFKILSVHENNYKIEFINKSARTSTSVDIKYLRPAPPSIKYATGTIQKRGPAPARNTPAAARAFAQPLYSVQILGTHNTNTVDNRVHTLLAQGAILTNVIARQPYKQPSSHVSQERSVPTYQIGVQFHERQGSVWMLESVLRARSPHYMHFIHPVEELKNSIFGIPKHNTVACHRHGLRVNRDV